MQFCSFLQSFTKTCLTGWHGNSSWSFAQIISSSTFNRFDATTAVILWYKSITLLLRVLFVCSDHSLAHILCFPSLCPTALARCQASALRKTALRRRIAFAVPRRVTFFPFSRWFLCAERRHFSNFQGLIPLIYSALPPVSVFFPSLQSLAVFLFDPCALFQPVPLI